VTELFQIFWRAKWLIAGVTSAGATISVIVALMLPDIYRSEALLMPNHSESGGALSALASQYGGLASLAGINLPDSSPDKTIVGLEILKSRKFIGEFVVRHDLLVPLMAANGWDSSSGQLLFDEDIYDIENQAWVRDIAPPRVAKPSLLEAHEVFLDEVLEVSEDKQSGLVTLAVQHYSPTVANQWVNWLVMDLNESVMAQDVAEAEQAIKYLNKQIESTSLSDLQNVFFRLIEEQTKTVMLANVADEYLFKTIDPAVAPEEKSKPMRALIVFLASILSGITGLVISLLFWREGKAETE